MQQGREGTVVGRQSDRGIVAQSLPRFGTARFGEAVFGQASTGADALPVPFMPLWATITLAVTLWVVAYLMRSKES